MPGLRSCPGPRGQTTSSYPIRSGGEVGAMTQVRARRGDREHDPHPAAKRNRYLELLRAPGALAFSSTGFVGRMSMSMYGLGTVLLIALLTGRYGQAGTIAAAGSVGYAVCGPFWALLATGIASGASMPSLGSMVRSRWSAIVGDDERRLHTAFALESVNDELIFVIGPAL